MATSKPTWQRSLRLTKLHLRHLDRRRQCTQYNNNNYVNNQSTVNSSTLNNVANSSSGNINANSAAGNFNQQKNDLAIASSGGRVAQAASAASQSSTNLVVENQGVQTYSKDTLKGTFSATGGFVAAGVAKTEGDDHGGHGGWATKAAKVAAALLAS